MEGNKERQAPAGKAEVSDDVKALAAAVVEIDRLTEAAAELARITAFATEESPVAVGDVEFIHQASFPNDRITLTLLMMALQNQRRK